MQITPQSLSSIENFFSPPRVIGKVLGKGRGKHKSYELSQVKEAKKDRNWERRTKTWSQVFRNPDRAPIVSSTSTIQMPHFILFYFIFIFEVLLVYSVVFVSDVQQNDSVIHTYISIFFRFFSLIGYSKISNIVPCTVQ